MKNKLLVFSFLFLALLSSCKNGPPILPGLTKSAIIITSNPDSTLVKVNNKEPGITPFSVEDLDPGFFKLAFSKFSYLAYNHIPCYPTKCN